MMNRNAVRSLAVILFAISTSLLEAPAADKGRKLADIYRTGHARLVAEATLDLKSMPEDVYFRLVGGMTVDRRGNVYVLDISVGDIKKFDGNGKFLKVIGRKGQGPGEYQSPVFVVAGGERLAVYDAMTFKISVLDLDGEFIKSIPCPMDSGPVKKIKGAMWGDLVLEKEKTYYDNSDRPQDCSISVLGRDLGQMKEVYARPVLRQVFRKTPKYFTIVLQPFRPDLHWAVDPNGRILIGFSEKYELEVYDPVKGKKTAFARAWEPVKVTADDRKRWLSRMIPPNEKELRDLIIENTGFPDQKPAFDGVLFDPEGNILVHPITREQDDDVYDAFTPDGKFISRVMFSGGGRGFNWEVTPSPDGAFWNWTIGPDVSWIFTKWRITE